MDVLRQRSSRSAPGTVVPLAFLLALAGCAGAPASDRGLPAGWRLAAENALVHDETGLVFPAEWEGLSRLAPRTRDQTGSDVSIGYSGPPRDTSLTLDIYPAGVGEEAEPAVQFDEAVVELLDAHPEAAVREASAMNLPFGYAARAGFGAYLSWPEEGAERGCFLVLLSRDERFYRVAERFRLDGSGEPISESWATLLAFLRTLEPPREE